MPRPFTVNGITQFHDWTHQSLDRLLAACEFLAATRIRFRHPAFAGRSIEDLFVHIYDIETAWVNDLRSAANLPVASPAAARSSLRSIQKACINGTRAYIATLSEEQLNITIRDTPPGWTGPARSPAFILHHVLTHAFHHEGQIASLLRLQGVAPPDTDLQFDNNP